MSVSPMFSVPKAAKSSPSLSGASAVAPGRYSAPSSHTPWASPTVGVGCQQAAQVAPFENGAAFVRLAHAVEANSVKALKDIAPLAVLREPPVFLDEALDLLVASEDPLLPGGSPPPLCGERPLRPAHRANSRHRL